MSTINPQDTSVLHLTYSDLKFGLDLVSTIQQYDELRFSLTAGQARLLKTSWKFFTRLIQCDPVHRIRRIFFLLMWSLAELYLGFRYKRLLLLSSLYIAENGYIDSPTYLAENGGLITVGLKKNHERWLNQLKRQASRGERIAQYNLAVHYADGKWVERDVAKALEWYRVAAKQNLPDAQYALGWMYGHGEGVERDDAAAIDWFRQAAEGGHVEAQQILGKAYANGLHGLPCDPVQAQYWFKKRGHDIHLSSTDNL